MQQHRRERRTHSPGIIMSTSWRQLWCRILLLLVLCEEIYTKTPNSTPPPLAAITPLQTDVRSVVLKGDYHTEKIQVLSPVNLTLECLWAGNPSSAATVSGVWRKDGGEIGNSRKTVSLENQQFSLRKVFNIDDEKALGNYSCMFGEEARIDFLVEAPQIGDVRDKPIVSYVGDYVVIECKLDNSKPKPNTWTWFRQNDTEKEILVSEESGRYKVKNGDKKTRLQVHNLTKDDSGFYYCGAVYAIQIATSQVELKVITFYEPLKPFIAIIIEVIILVAAILLYERCQSRKKTDSIPLTTTTGAEEGKAVTSAESEVEDKSSSVRHRSNTEES